MERWTSPLNCHANRPQPGFHCGTDHCRQHFLQWNLSMAVFRFQCIQPLHAMVVDGLDPSTEGFLQKVILGSKVVLHQGRIDSCAIVDLPQGGEEGFRGTQEAL